MWKIYKINCSVSGKSYIGQTKDKLQTRINKHVNDAKRNSQTFIGRAIRKYGWSKFTVTVIEDGISTQEQADLRECHYILNEKTLCPSGYNLKAGGQSKGSSVCTISKFIPANYKKKTIKVTGIKDGISTSFRTIRDASRFYNIEPQHIQTAIKKYGNTKGVYFCKTEDYERTSTYANIRGRKGKFVKIKCSKTGEESVFTSLESCKAFLGSVKNFSTYVKKGWKINGYNCFYITESEYLTSQSNNGQTV